MKKLTKINKKEKSKGFLCSLFRVISEKRTERNSLLPRAPLDLKSYLRLWLLWFFRLYHSAKKENHGRSYLYICINSFNFLYWFRKFMASYTTNYELLTSSIKILDNSTIALQRPNARRKRRHSYVQNVVAYTCEERDSQHSVLSGVWETRQMKHKWSIII